MIERVFMSLLLPVIFLSPGPEGQVGPQGPPGGGGVSVSTYLGYLAVALDGRIDTASDPPAFSMRGVSGTLAFNSPNGFTFTFSRSLSAVTSYYAATTS